MGVKNDAMLFVFFVVVVGGALPAATEGDLRFFDDVPSLVEEDPDFIQSPSAVLAVLPLLWPDLSFLDTTLKKFFIVFGSVVAQARLL